ncbi:MAG: OsmC family peroxiredoxin [Burkholderiales bacterium]|nr:MAG: OsmC family peroxiredoxin [Burkholderiales bacterium]
MSDHAARLLWQRDPAEPFVDQRYSRRHTWHFDGGAVVPGSSSPSVVRPPFSDPGAVDPEEALVAAASSCHLLWFLSLAADAGWCVDRYEDEAVGHMGRDERGRAAITRIVLRPRVRFGGRSQPDEATLARLHHDAHDACFIANSLRSEIVCEPRP